MGPAPSGANVSPARQKHLLPSESIATQQSSQMARSWVVPSCALDLDQVDGSECSTRVNRRVIEALHSQPSLPPPHHGWSVGLVRECMDKRPDLRSNAARVEGQVENKVLEAGRQRVHPRIRAKSPLQHCHRGQGNFWSEKPIERGSQEQIEGEAVPTV